MSVLKTQPVDIDKYLSPELRNDLYVQDSVYEACPQGGLLLVGEGATQSVMRHRRLRREGRNEVDVWCEARSEGARELLDGLCEGEMISLTVGNVLGLRLAQEYLQGRVEPYHVFCTINCGRLRVAQLHRVQPLGREGRERLRDYPDPYNLQSILEDSSLPRRLYICERQQAVVGYAAAPFGPRHNAVWVHVRPDFRGLGYGRSLLSVATEDLLLERETVVFHACLADMAPLRLAVACGFAPTRQVFVVRGTRRKGTDQPND